MTEYAQGVLPGRTDTSPGPREVMVVRLYLTSATFTVAVMVIATATIATWLFDVPGLSHVWPALGRVQIHASLTLLVSAIAAWAYRLRTETPAVIQTMRFAGGAAVALAALTMLKHFGWDVTVDHWFGAPGVSAHSGRSALASSLGILLLHGALISAANSPRYTLPQVLAGSVLTISILGTMGYFFSLEDFGGPGTSDVTSLAMAIGLLLLGLAFFFARPEQGVMDVVVDAGPAGIITRQLVPVVFVVPPESPLPPIANTGDETSEKPSRIAVAPITAKVT